jgi:hypothetical protein
VGAVVSRVIAAPIDVVWRVFTETTRRATWVDPVADARLRLTVTEPGRQCVVALASTTGRRRNYAFTPIVVGPHRGGTVVSVVEDRGALHVDRLFDLVSGGFVARAVEGAVRKELDALAAACTIRVIVATAA